jgi:hypothetical protein
MRKIFHLFLCILLSFFLHPQLFAENDIDIITREQWWANEEYRYRDSDIWKEIIRYEEDKRTRFTREEIKYKKDTLKKAIDAWKYLQTFFADQLIRMRIRTKENKRELAWPIEHSKYIKWIVVHHTVNDSDDMKQVVRNIYKFHAIDRKWWDIWYNFLIWKNGEVYEWRAWWEKTIAWHDKWNNVWNIWIALIWDYWQKGISEKQKKWLKKLMKYLINKYEINLNKKIYFHKECREDVCNNVLESKLSDPIIGHRDAWHTTCPGEELYKQLLDIRFELKQELKFSLINQEKLHLLFQRFSHRKLIKLEEKLHKQVERWLENNSMKQKKITFLEEILYGIHVYLRN